MLLKFDHSTYLVFQSEIPPKFIDSFLLLYSNNIICIISLPNPQGLDTFMISILSILVKIGCGQILISTHGSYKLLNDHSTF